MHISLIVTSRGNKLALKRLFNSISSQAEIDLENIEVIFADQANDKDLVNDYADKFKIIYTKIPLSSLSSARNQVLKFANGSIIGFPDDDCWYPANFLNGIFSNFEMNPTQSMWLCNIKDPRNNRYYGNRPTDVRPLNEKNIYYLPSSVSIFLNCAIIEKEDIIFNEFLGVGSKWGAGEDVELAFKIFKKYSNCTYDGTQNVYHPVIIGGDTLSRSYNYGIGSGALAANLFVNQNYKHFPVFFEYVSRSFIGAVYYLLLFKLDTSKAYFARLKGLILGLVLGYIFFKKLKSQ